MSTEATDETLLQRWRDGDGNAGCELTRRHFGSIVGFFRYRTDEGIDDLVQRTFVACVEGRDRVPDGVGVRAYILGIAHKLWLNTLRKHHREHRAMDRVRHAPRSTATSPSRVLAMREEQRLLLHALRRLPTDLQTTIELFYWERLKLVEIGVVTGVPVGTVKSRLARAKAALRREIEAIGPTRLGQSTVDELDRWARSLAKVTRDTAQ